MAALRIKPAPALPVINLANGGGTIPGMGEKFSVNPVTPPEHRLF
jgi:hypothetical protein